jgi:hypothetical protein
MNVAYPDKSVSLNSVPDHIVMNTKAERVSGGIENIIYKLVVATERTVKRFIISVALADYALNRENGIP